MSFPLTDIGISLLAPLNWKRRLPSQLPVKSMEARYKKFNSLPVLRKKKKYQENFL